MRKLSDAEMVETFEALIEDRRALDGDRRDDPLYLACLQVVARLKAHEKATDAERYLALALAGMEEHPVRPGVLRDVAMKLRAYWPMVREALRKYGFACKARASSQGAEPPAECTWPICGCDPYASKVIDSLQESGLLEGEGI